jgi:mannitol/fructose-specific phosphotransferase system IIA component (Ntr-type)
MNLTDILSQEQLLPKLTVTDRWAAIDALVEVLIRLGKLRAEERNSIREAIKARESKTSTGIGYGIALPHASIASIQEVVAIVAKLSPPVDFHALDNQPVKLCVLFLTPQGQFQQHLQTLSTFARFLTNKDNREKLDAAQTAAEMLSVLRGPA